MDVLQMCRVCLVNNIRMYFIVNTNLQEIFEKLAGVPLKTENSRPLHVCYICCARLRNCYQLQIKCRQSEQMFSQMIEGNGFNPTSLPSTNTFKIVHPIHLSNAPAVSENSYDVQVVDLKVEPIEMLFNVQVKEEPFEGQEVLTQTAEDGIVNLNLENVCTDSDVENGGIHLENGDYIDSDEVYVENGGVYLEHGNYYVENDDVIVDVGLHDVSSEGDVDVKEEDVYIEEDYVNIDFDELGHSTGDNINQLQDYSIQGTQILDKDSSFECDNKKIGEGKYKRDFSGTQNKKNIAVKENLHGTKYSNKFETGNLKQNKHIFEKYQTKDKSMKNNIRLDNSSELDRITNDREYKCNLCDKRFVQKRNLNSHVRIHTHGKPYNCDICKKCFNRKANLDTHRLIHTGVKLYTCDVCNKCFNARNDLIRHILVHSGEKPHKTKRLI